LKNKTLRFSLQLTLFLSITACAPNPKLQEIDLNKGFESAVLSESEQKNLKNGDIILRRGYGMVSDYIVNFLQEPIPLTHCGILLRSVAGDSVISSESDELQGIDGVQTTSLSVFLRDAQPNSVLAVRLKNSSPQQISSIIATANYYKKQKIGFDYSFNLQDSSKMYCAEFLKIVVKNSLNRDIINEISLKTTLPLLRMQQFYDTTKFDIVIRQGK
jgi:Permuted papain-like amidase enzyme, YaeF/YiiX, C92 family